MTRLRSLLSGALLLAFALALAPSALAQTPYPIAWPADAPVWEMTVLSPELSSGPNGQGLEIRDLTYNGRLVMKRGGVPILNVKYEQGCNCFRDWQDSEVRFLADNPITPSWIAESTPGTVATMCDAAPANCTDSDGDGEVDFCNDVGSFEGVAIERFETFLRLTTHMRAGWYRYTMRWEFHADGTIRPLFGFTSTGTSCTQNPRRHHAYWRFDFDIDGAESDYVVETGPDEAAQILGTETTRLWTGTPPDLSGEISEPETVAATGWEVYDKATGRGYRLKPSAADLLTPANPETGNPSLDDFAKEDFALTRYKANEIDDGASGCTAKFTSEDTSNPIVNGEDVRATDVVVWYRSGVTKPDIDPGHCYESGPILTPIGDWSGPEGAAVAAEANAAPASYTLAEAYPNPFERSTTVRFSVDTAQDLTLRLYDAVGREVRVLWSGAAAAGAEESVVIDGAGLPSGVYTVRLEGASGSASTRIVLLK